MVQFPDSESFASLVRGALYLLSQEENYEAFGALTPQETGDAMRQTLFSFLEEDCVIVPVGAMLEFAGDVLPVGYLWCDGAAVSRALYADLFDVVGVAFGGGNGTTTFNVPDRRGRVGVGVDPSDNDFSTLGIQLGAKTHTLTTAQLPSHNHADATFDAGTPAAITVQSGTGANIKRISQTTGNSGGGTAHNNIQPSLVDNYIIKF